MTGKLITNTHVLFALVLDFVKNIPKPRNIDVFHAKDPEFANIILFVPIAAAATKRSNVRRKAVIMKPTENKT